MLYIMLASYKETETSASRVIYINSKDATSIMGNNRSDFDFTLEEPIVVPPHHNILLSVYSAEIPFSFYIFRNGVNCKLDFAITAFNAPATYTAAGFLDTTTPGAGTLQIPEGNYNAVELALLLTNGIVGLECLYDPNKLKFYGYTNPNPGVAGPGIDNNLAGPFLTSPEWFLYSDDVGDLTNSVRSLFMRTNLSTTSILDSHIGGGFSNILTRVPIKVQPGQILNIDPVNGDVHKLLLKLKTITNISIRLTNQKNETIDLNGLDFDVSLKLEFIEDRQLKEPPNVREVLYQQSQKFSDEQALLEEQQRHQGQGKTGKLKEKKKKDKKKKK